MTLGKIAYVMSRFPHLPETFILREMEELIRQGWHVELYPLIRQQQKVIHDEARPWVERARYSPFLSPKVLRANCKAALLPGWQYYQLWQRVVMDNLMKPEVLFRSLALFPKAVFLSEQMIRDGIQHIHAHYATYPALVAWAIHQLSGISYSITVHAHDIFVTQVMLKTKLRDAAFIVAISEFNKRFLVERVDPLLEDKIRVIHCGIDPSWYQFEETCGTQPERLEIINIGSLQPYKGQIYLLKACALLKQRGVPFRCRIIGAGPEQKRLERFILQHHLEGQVVLLGAQTQEYVAHTLPKAHCYVQPSVITLTGKMEGIPVAIMEALAAGLPVIATEISGIPELVIDHQTGFLVPPEDEIALADRLQYVFENLEQARAMAANGRQLVLEEYNLAKNVQELGANLKSVTMGSPG